MNEELLFGCAYYLEYLPFDRMQEDMQMMKRAGMNVIRIAESTWSTLEPRDGEFDFTCIDKMLAAANQNDLKVIIGTPTYAIPSWMVKKADDIMVCTREGQKRYGHRQSMNIQSKTFRFYAERVIRRLMEHVCDDPAVIGYQIDNETKHYGTACEAVQEQFKTYLKEKFKTTQALNKAFYLNYWSNAIHDWEEHADMRGCINGGLAGEFAAFQRGLVTQYLGWQADIIAEYKRPEQFVTQNFDFEWKKFGADIAQDGYSYGVQPDVEHAPASRMVTIAGTDIYHPTQSLLTGAEIAFGGDEIRSLKQDNYLVLECQAQAFKYWTPYPGQLRLQAYSHLASGSKSLLYWHWHSIHNGYETYWKGLLSHDFQTNPTYEEACVFGNEWKKIGAQRLQLKKRNKIALLVDNRTLTSFQWFPIDRELSYNDVVRWMYDSLYELNLECDVVFPDNLDVSRYEMIVTPALYCAEETLISELKRFVQEGGTLISSFKSFVADACASVYTDVQPHGMTDLFGISYNQFTEPERMHVMGSEVKYFAELLRPLKKEEGHLPEAGSGAAQQGLEVLASYEHPYWNSYAAITHNRFGKGNAYYIGCYLDKSSLKEVYRRAAGADEQWNLPVWPIILRSGENQCGERVHYLLHYGEQQKEFICPYEQVTDILTETAYHRGDAIQLKDWDVKVLIENK